MDALNKACLNRRDEGGVRIERPMFADFAFKTKRQGIGWQQELNGGGIKANAMVEAVDFIRRINAFDRHHRHQDLDFGDLRGITREQRLDIMRLWALHDKIHPIGGNVDARQGIHDFIDLRNHNAALKSGCLNNNGRVLSIGASK